MEQLGETLNPASVYEQVAKTERTIRVRGVLASKNFQEIGKRLESLLAETDIPEGRFENWVKTELGMAEEKIAD